MKKLPISLLAVLGLFATLFMSCDEEDDGLDIAPPVFTADPDNMTINVGATTTLSYTVTTPGGYQSSSVASSSDAIATATISTEPATSTDSQGTFEVTVTGVAAGQATITLTVTDNQAQSATNDVVIDVTTGMPMIATVADTVATIDSLSSLSAAIGVAGLTDALNGAGPFTLFAPSNAAIDSLIAGLEVADLTALVEALGGANALSGVLQAHVIADSLPADLLMAQEYETLNAASTITITTEGDNVYANGAQVIQPNIIAGNGVIHIIDSLINVEAPTAEAEEGTVQVVSSEEEVGTTTWTANNTYILNGFVYVNDGQTLTIEPGTVIKGRPGQAARASALIVAQGGTIEANGTAEAPIIFTAEADDLEGSVPDDANGLWGGVIILGNASTNNLDVNGVKNVEGIPTDETRGAYGGTDDADDSGTLTYVSIRYGGSVIGANNEINGLTLGELVPER